MISIININLMLNYRYIINYILKFKRLHYFALIINIFGTLKLQYLISSDKSLILYHPCFNKIKIINV